MGFQRDRILDRIHCCTPEAREFIDLWFDELPYITAHTSGSTGSPKEIQLLKTDMVASARSTNRYFGITPYSTLLCPLSADYIAGKMMIVRAIVSGAELWLEVPTNHPVQNDYGIVNLISVVPSQIPYLLDRKDNLAKLRTILIGGAQLPIQLSERITEAGIDAYVSYGMTETCSHVALRKVRSSEPEIYEAMPDISFSKDNRDCLVINSKTRSFKELYTNDIVQLMDSRHFLWKGRLDNVINSGGIKVYPEEIEQQIRTVMPRNLEFYIAKSDDEKWGEVPVLIVSEDIADKDALLKAARNAVHHKAQRPAKVIYDEIRHTTSGKIIRKKRF